MPATDTTPAVHFIPENLPTRIQHFIGGRFVDSVSGKTFDVLDPVSNQTYATAAAGQQEDIDLAVTAATEAFENGSWPGMKPRERSRILNRIAGRPLDAFATERTLAELDKRFDYAFKPWTPPWFFRPALVPRRVAPGDMVETAGLQVRVFEQDHGYLPTLGLRVGGFGYSTDVATLDEAAFAVLAGVDTWVVDCFQRQSHKTHANLDQVLRWTDRLQPRRVVLTHMGYDIDWAWLTQRLPPGIEPGHDGQILDCP